MIDILILDDDHPTCLFLTEVLIEEGYQVVHAGSGSVGLALLAVSNPRLILCDVCMPVMDGPTFASQSRARPDLPHPPIVFMTANPALLPPNTAVSMGLTKPFDLDGLLTHVAALLSRSTTTQEHRSHEIVLTSLSLSS